MNQYDIILVNLDPAMGGKIQKPRRRLIISPKDINHNLNTLIIAPMTTTSKEYPTRVKVRHQGKDAWIAIDQIHTVDQIRAIKSLGKLNNSEISIVKSLVNETFVG